MSGQHALAAQAELDDGERIRVLVIGRLVTGFEAIVVEEVGQHVTRAQVTGLQPLGPWHPGRREDGVRTWQQLGLGHRGRAASRDPGEGDGPFPTSVPTRKTREAVRDDALGLGDHP